MNEQHTKEIADYTMSVLDESMIFMNPYFNKLRDGTMSLASFQSSQKQFYYAVRFFVRPMTTLMARIPDPVARLEILENVIEEHGNMKKDEFHRSTFELFLNSIGVEEVDITKIPLHPSVRMFNSALACACMIDEVEVGVGCLGAIERAFADISAIIGKAVVDRGWVENDNLVHYKLHAKIDIKHAEDFFKVVSNDWQNPKRQYFIKQGIQLGVYIFDRMYKDLAEL